MEGFGGFGGFIQLKEETMQKTFRGNLMAMAVASALAGASGAAGAAGFALIEQSGSGMGNAYAGAAATAEDASTIFFNPAGITQVPGKQIVAAGHLIDLSAKFHNSGTTAPAAMPGVPFGGEGGDAGGIALVPNFYFAMPLNEQLSFGVGVNSPFGLVTEYDEDWMGRYQGVKSELLTVNINPTLAFKVNDMFSIGGGLNYQRLDVELTNSVVLAANTEGRAKLEADDDAWGWNVGALFMPTPATKIGVSYRSKMEYTLEGDTTVKTLAGTTVGAASGATHADVTLPDSFSVSLAQKLNDQWEFLADVSFTRWSEINQIDIVNSANGTLRDRLILDFDDTWRYSVGANYKLNDSWKLKGGIAFDQSPVKGADTRSVRLPDNDRTWVSVGAQVTMKQIHRLDFGYSHLFLKDADINFGKGQFVTGTTTVNPATVSNVRGTYEGSVDLFSVQYTVTF
jgi:long-chain fatty acid transport protein